MNRFELLLDDGTLSADAGAILAVHPAPSPILNAFDRLDCIQPLKPACAALEASGLRVLETPEGPYEAVLLRLPRSRDEARGLFALSWEAARVGAVIAVTGNKTDGVDAFAKALLGLGLAPEARPKAHGKVLWLVKEEDTPPALSAWAEAGRARQTEEGFWTAPGLFSADNVDAGSALLRDHLPAALSGNGADLGAGWGFLSQAALAKAPGIASLALVEADRRALDLARHNVSDPRITLLWEDATRPQDLPRGLDFVIMNPPFHTGRADEPDLGRAFIASASAMLSPKGRLFMVANLHLPYEETLDRHFSKRDVLAETPRYKVIAASRPILAKRRS